MRGAKLLGTVNDSYRAQLVGSQVMYDATNRWSVGGLLSVLQGTGGDRQYAYGLKWATWSWDNLWVTLGYPVCTPKPNPQSTPVLDHFKAYVTNGPRTRPTVTTSAPARPVRLRSGAQDGRSARPVRQSSAEDPQQRGHADHQPGRAPRNVLTSCPRNRGRRGLCM